jgi:hypothetical protein
MVDFILMVVCCVGILVLLLLRWLYAKSLTGLTMGDSVSPTYWGSYTQVQPNSAGTIQLPKAQGVCPACQRGSRTGTCTHPRQY